jgi:outer membrane protein assembly factor BamD
MRALALVLLVLLVPALDACKSARGKEKADPLMRLSAAESLEMGRTLMEKKKYASARKYLTHAFEVEPNSASGREALLMVADSLYHQGGRDNLTQAEAKYRDFLNRFPTSDKAPYVQFQIGASLAGRVERADRDQNVTRQALTAFEEVPRLYPTSDQVDPAKEKIAKMRTQLGEHEFMVARFYLRYGLPGATVSRLAYLLNEYPEYAQKDKVYYYLGVADLKMDQTKEAAHWFEKLRQEFPQSAYVKDIPAVADKVEKTEKAEKS